MRKKAKRLTEATFGEIKKLLAYGVKPKYITEITGYSLSTVSAVNKFNTLEDHKKDVQTRIDKLRNKTTKPVIEQVKVNMDEHNSIVTVLKSIEYNQQRMIKLLESISTNTSKKGWFN